ncbi:helix-turn-helix transcriptional regulator [Mucilaginibacter sp.]|uniref:helix-turn-helix domain-containing protein n=1 Tax=Mucilaginibacter sp. TaxID=1882438 RepID=UPI0035BC2386
MYNLTRHQLPAGLVNSNGEFFVCDDDQPHLLRSGSVVDFDQFDPKLILLLEIKMLSETKRHAYYSLMVAGAGRMAEVRQFTYCMYGGFDNKPDIINGELGEPEYWRCPKRGNCDFEGKACAGFKLKSGDHLTRRELQYIQLTANGLLDKTIADQLGISPKTVPSFSKQVREKCGLQRKADIASWAKDNHLA